MRRWRVVVWGLVAACGSGPDADPGLDSDLPGDADTEVAPADTVVDGEGDSEPPVDTDPTVPGLPDLVFEELLVGWCNAATPCRVGWEVPGEPPLPGLEDVEPVGSSLWSAVTAGRGLAGPDDDRVTVIVDVLRDRDGDGVDDQRGLLLAYDPDLGALVDHPGLPDDFVAAGLLSPEPSPLPLDEVLFLDVRDLDGDGQGELLFGRAPDVLWRFDAALGVFVPDAGVSALVRSLDDVVVGQSVHVADVDLDGLTDVELTVTPRPGVVPTRGPLVTLLGRADGGWELADLYARPADVTTWIAASGIATLWSAPGGEQLRFTAGDEIGSCWRKRRDGRGFVRDDAGLDLYEACDLAAQPDGTRSNVTRLTPMGIASGFDLDRDGRSELVVTTTDRALDLLDTARAFPDARFQDLVGYGAVLNTTIPSACLNGAPIVPDDDGAGWTCAPSSERALPWGILPADLDADGWVDLVSAAGGDVHYYVTCARDPADPACVVHHPLLVWHHRGDADPWVPSPVGGGSLPILERWPLRQRGGNVAPYGDWNGLAALDLDDDGDLDWLLSTFGRRTSPAVFRNDTAHPNRSLCLRPRGQVSSPEGGGSFVEVTATIAGATTTQHAQVGVSGNPNAGAATEVCFGLGDATTADVRWRWPTGADQRLTGVPTRAANEPGGPVTIEEPAWAELYTFDGATVTPGTRDVPAGQSQVLRLCAPKVRQAWGAAPVPEGGLWSVRITDVAGVTPSLSAFRSSALPPRAGCEDYRLYASRPSLVIVTATFDGRDLPWRPRLAWR